MLFQNKFKSGATSGLSFLARFVYDASHIRIVTLLIFFLSGLLLAEESATPKPIENLLTTTKTDIYEYEYQSKRVFLVDNRKRCCDLGAELYDANAKLVCRFIGFVGRWEEKCADFDKSAKLIRTISAKATVAPK